MRLALALLLAALPLSGCFEGSPPAPPSGGGGGDGSTAPGRLVAFDRAASEPVGFHAWSTCGFCHGQPDDPEQRVLVAFADGSVVFVHYAPVHDEHDGPPTVRFDDDVSFDHEQLTTLLRGMEPGAHGSRTGYHVGEVETGVLAAPLLGALRTALNESFREPPAAQLDCVDCPGHGTFGRPDNGTWETFHVIGYDEDAEESRAFRELHAAFSDAAGLFDAKPPSHSSYTPPPDAPTRSPTISPVPPTRGDWEMRNPATPECIRFSVGATPDPVAAGAGATIVATVKNVCDRTLQVQGTNGCAPQGVLAWIEVEGERYTFTREGAAATTLACAEYLPAPIDIGAGDELVVEWRWNGTLVDWNGSDGGAEDTRTLGAGEYALLARITQPTGLPEASGRLRVD